MVLALPALPNRLSLSPRSVLGLAADFYTGIVPVSLPEFTGAAGGQPDANVLANAVTCSAALVPVPTGLSCAARPNYTIGYMLTK